MAKKRKAKAKKRVRARDKDGEAAEELLALEAIYGEELSVLPDRSGFSLLIVPHPGEAEANHVSVRVTVRQVRDEGRCQAPCLAGTHILSLN